MSATCKSCGAVIVWAVTAAGKSMPVDADASTDGTIELRYERNQISAVVHAGTNGVTRAGSLHTSHFATCPFAKQHRNPRRGGTR
jgi:hypothetical protein